MLIIAYRSFSKIVDTTVKINRLSNRSHHCCVVLLNLRIFSYKWTDEKLQLIFWNVITRPPLIRYEFAVELYQFWQRKKKLISTRIVPVLAGLPLFSAPASDALLLQSCEILKKKSYSVLSLFIQHSPKKDSFSPCILILIKIWQLFMTMRIASVVESFFPVKGWWCKMTLLPPVVSVMYNRSRRRCKECIFERDWFPTRVGHFFPPPHFSCPLEMARSSQIVTNCESLHPFMPLKRKFRIIPWESAIASVEKGRQ